MKRIGMSERDRHNRTGCEHDDQEKSLMLRAKKKTIADVFEQVEVLIDAHFNELNETKPSAFLKYVLANQSAIEMSPIKKTEDNNMLSEDHEGQL